VDAQGVQVDLKPSVDFTPLSLSASRTFDLPLVFAGYGITAPVLDYDDYAGIDVAGKAVIILRHEPRQADPHSPFSGTENSEHAYFAPKIANAIQHGAAAVILCTDAYDVDRRLVDSVEQGPVETRRAGLDELLDFKVRANAGERAIPVLHCKRAVIDPLVKSAVGLTLAELESQIDESLVPHSRALEGCAIRGEVSVLEQGRTLKNVAGRLDGDGSIDSETIIVGAHYDHLGLGGWGSLAIGVDDEIHNGADDNASGTAVLLEVARQLATRPKRLRRPVLFLAFTAEEMGLVGSEHYVRDPLVPLEQTVAMLNLDMVGRLRQERLIVSGTGTATEFDPLVEKLARNYGFKLSKDPSGYGPSDHATFYGHGVPVLHFFTGLHGDYHRPSDDFDKLNLDGMRRIAGMVADAVIELANADAKPTWSNSMQSLLADVSPDLSSGGEAKPFLGIMHDADFAGVGYAILRIVGGGPADRAGLRPGDVILQFADQPIEAAATLQAAIASSTPGTKVKLKCRRGQVDIELEVEIGKRSG
jgi:hypothetical protein